MNLLLKNVESSGVFNNAHFLFVTAKSNTDSYRHTKEKLAEIKLSKKQSV